MGERSRSPGISQVLEEVADTEPEPTRIDQVGNLTEVGAGEGINTGNPIGVEHIEEVSRDAEIARSDGDLLLDPEVEVVAGIEGVGTTRFDIDGSRTLVQPGNPEPPCPEGTGPHIEVGAQVDPPRSEVGGVHLHHHRPGEASVPFVVLVVPGIIVHIIPLGATTPCGSDVPLRPGDGDRTHHQPVVAHPLVGDDDQPIILPIGTRSVSRYPEPLAGVNTVINGDLLIIGSTSNPIFAGISDGHRLVVIGDAPIDIGDDVVLIAMDIGHPEGKIGE